MGDVISHGQFIEKRRQKLKARAQRTPHQLAQEKLLRDEGYKFERVTPAGSLMFTKKVEENTKVALIDKDGAVSKHIWEN